MNKLALLACGTMASLLLGAGTVSANHDVRYSNRTIEGAWLVVTTVRLPADDCATSPPVPVGPNPFPTFNTFHEGGTMSEWGSRSPPATRSSGHGV